MNFMPNGHVYRSDNLSDAMASAFITSNQVPELPVFVNWSAIVDGKKQLGYFVSFERGDCKAVIEGGKKVEYNN